MNGQLNKNKGLTETFTVSVTEALVTFPKTSLANQRAERIFPRQAGEYFLVKLFKKKKKKTLRIRGS